MLHILTGALQKLTYAFAYEEDGDLNPEQAASLAAGIYASYLTGGDYCMIGTLATYITEDPPTGVLPCDGSTYDDVDYPLLAAVIDSQWDNGDGTFTLPDLRGRSVVGVGAGAGLTARAMGDTGGAETHQLIVSEMPAHDHTYVPPVINVDIEAPGVPDPLAAGLGVPTATGSTGGGGAHENMMPFVAVSIGVWAE